MSFGSFVRERRLGLDLSLRKFAEMLQMDHSRWSKIERDRLPFPEDEGKFDLLVEILKIVPKSDEWYNLKDLVSISRREIPAQVYEDQEILNALPIFFRTASGVRPTEGELQKIINLLKGR